MRQDSTHFSIRIVILHFVVAMPSLRQIKNTRERGPPLPPLPTHLPAPPAVAHSGLIAENGRKSREIKPPKSICILAQAARKLSLTGSHKTRNKTPPSQRTTEALCPTEETSRVTTGVSTPVKEQPQVKAKQQEPMIRFSAEKDVQRGQILTNKKHATSSIFEFKAKPIHKEETSGSGKELLGRRKTRIRCSSSRVKRGSPLSPPFPSISDLRGTKHKDSLKPLVQTIEPESSESQGKRRAAEELGRVLETWRTPMSKGKSRSSTKPLHESSRKLSESTSKHFTLTPQSDQNYSRDASPGSDSMPSALKVPLNDFLYRKTHETKSKVYRGSSSRSRRTAKVAQYW